MHFGVVSWNGSVFPVSKNMLCQPSPAPDSISLCKETNEFKGLFEVSAKDRRNFVPHQGWPWCRWMSGFPQAMPDESDGTGHAAILVYLHAPKTAIFRLLLAIVTIDSGVENGGMDLSTAAPNAIPGWRTFLTSPGRHLGAKPRMFPVPVACSRADHDSRPGPVAYWPLSQFSWYQTRMNWCQRLTESPPAPIEGSEEPSSHGLQIFGKTTVSI